MTTDIPAQHTAQGPQSARCAVITVSDTRTLETDTGGQGVIDHLTIAGHSIVAREIIPVMQAMGNEEEEAARVLGASGLQTFVRVTLPNIKWGLLYGVILCNARAMGEFGAVSVVSGHIRGLTNTLPLHVEILYNEYNFQAAFAVASLLACLALLTLVLKAIVLSSALIWLAVLIGNVSAHWIQRSADLTPSFKVLISKLVKIALIGFAGAIALSATGIDLTALTVFSGAVGVGIGFGLQKVVSNFISGMILLFERSMKVGDYVEVGGGMAGTLREINMRSSTLHTGDGKEIMVPNEKFITSAFVNWTKSDPLQRFASIERDLLR